MDEELIHQVGLLLTQLRYARRALEDVERSTSRYNSFAFAAALSQGAKFGEPPMFAGALKVWVVNINDLAPGAGGGFLEQLLGGVGRLIGGVGSGFAGGVLGGLFGGWNLPDLITKIGQVADSIDRVLTKLGIGFSDDKDKDKDKDKDTGPGLIQKIQQLTAVLDTFTALFLAAASRPEDAQKTSSSLTPGAERWMQIVSVTSELMARIDHVVQGLTILIPVVIGALADLLVRLDTIKLAVVELLQFVLRELLLLRGVVLVTLYDTVSAAAKLVSAVLGILSVAFSAIATSVIDLFKHVFDAAVTTIKFLADGLQSTINQLAGWLVDVIGQALFTIGDSLVFREIVHLVQVLPVVLPPLVLAIRGESAFKLVDTAALKAIAGTSMASPVLPGVGKSGSLPPPPALSSTLLPPGDVAALDAKLKTSIDGVKTVIGDVFGKGKLGLDTVSRTLDDAAKDKTFTTALDGHIEKVKASANNLADAFGLAQKAAADAVTKNPDSGLQAVATAYEAWLAGKGLKSLLDDVTQYFSRPGAADAIKDKAIGPTTVDRPRATVDIQDVIIELEPPPDAGKPTPTTAPSGAVKPTALQTPEDTLNLLVELVHELNERGFKFDDGSLLTQI